MVPTAGSVDLSRGAASPKPPLQPLARYLLCVARLGGVLYGLRHHAALLVARLLPRRLVGHEVGVDRPVEVLDGDLSEHGDEVVRVERDALDGSVHRELAVLADGASDEDLAAGHRLHLALRLAPLFGGTTHQPDIGRLRLAARVGAACPVDAQRLGDGDALLKVARDGLGGAIGLDPRRAAELRAGAADDVADDVARLDGKAGGAVEAGLRQQRLERAVVHVGQDDVLLDGQPHLAARVPVGEVGDLPRLGDRDAPHRHVYAHARLARLRLRVHAEEGAPLKGRGGLGLRLLDLGRHLLDDPLAEGLAGLRVAVDLLDLAIVLDEPHEAALLPVLAAALVAEDAQDGGGEIDRRLHRRGDPEVEVDALGHALDGHVAAQDDVEAHLARLGMHVRLQADVVDVRVRVVVAAARDGNVELARQVAPHRVAALARLDVERDQVVERLADRARVNRHIGVVDARERVADEVAYVVKRRLEARLPAGVQPVDDLVRLAELDAAELDVLARRDVDHAELGPVRLDAVGVEAHEVGVDDAVGNAHPHHELARRAFVAVDEPDPLEPRVHVHLLDVLPIHRARTDGGRVLVHAVVCGSGVLGQLGLLDRVAVLRALERLLG